MITIGLAMLFLSYPAHLCAQTSTHPETVCSLGDEWMVGARGALFGPFL